MATSYDFISYVLDQLKEYGNFTSKRMFGEYMIYWDSCPLFLVCDNTVYCKQLPALESLMQSSPKGFPYPGAKLHHIVDFEDQNLLSALLPLIKPFLSLPKKKKKQ